MDRRQLSAALAALLLPAMLLPGQPVASASPTSGPPAPLVGPREDPAGDRGRWAVTATGPDSWTVSWEAPERFPVGDDRPAIVAAEGVGGVPAGSPVGVPTVADDGRTVEVSLVSGEPPAPASLDVVLSGELLDEGTSVDSAGPAPAPRWEPPKQTLLPDDPARPGGLPVATSDYRLPGLDVPGMRRDVEMVGHVVKPAAGAADPSHPLVLFLHGRHSYCYDPETGRTGWRWPCAGAQVPVPSHLGYDYVQRLLAGQGFVTVSVAANGINAQDGNSPDGGAAARSQLIQAHLDQWARWAGRRHQVDLRTVVLVGHSRGGEGASRAALEIPLSAPYTVVGQVLIGPTSFARQTTPYVPAVTVLPSCDGDVVDLQGQTYTDVARGLADGDTAMKSSILSIGANHNFFNTEWTPGLAAAPAWDDWVARKGVCGSRSEDRLSAAEQRRVAKAYVAGAVHLFAAGDQDYAPMFDGSSVRVGSTGDAVVLSHMVGGGRTMRVPGRGASLTTAVGAEAALCDGTTPWRRTPEPLCGRYARAPEATPHWPTEGSLNPTSQALELSWEAAGGRGGLRLRSALDLRGSEWLDLRTVVDPEVGDVAVELRVSDRGGASTVVEPVGGGRLPALPSGEEWPPGKYWAQTLRVAVPELRGIDRSDVGSVELVGRSDRGRVWVLDIAAADDALPPVPAERVPLIDLGRVRVEEGGDGTHVAEVPFTVTGAVEDGGGFRVYGHPSEETGEPVVVDVPVPAGSRGGTVRWEYPGDTVDSYPAIALRLVGHATRNVMMRDSDGRVIVTDDDPSPQVTMRAVRPAAPEGGHARLEATLSAPAGIEISGGIRVVRGDGSAAPLRAHDVTVRWLRSWTSWEEGTDPPLHALEVGQWAFFRPGETTLVFRVPIRADGRAESHESLTVRGEFGSGTRTAPVTVRVPANG